MVRQKYQMYWLSKNPSIWLAIGRPSHTQKMLIKEFFNLIRSETQQASTKKKKDGELDAAFPEWLSPCKKH